jgi:cysteine desulfurase
MNKEIYLDYASATPLNPKAKRVMFDCMNEFANASSVHPAGRRANKILNASRSQVAKIIGAKTDEIIFTGSGTESDNLAILGIARKYGQKGKHIITSKIEHPAVIRVCQYLETEGFEIAYLDVDSEGLVSPDAVKKALRKDTILVSIMYANNEIGTIQPIRKIGEVIREFKKGNATPVFHSDACQAGGALDLNIQKLGLDLMTLNGSKIYGPKGTGCLYVKLGTNLNQVLFGGEQELGLRPGTENIAGIAGFAKALELADLSKNKEGARLEKLRDFTIESVLKNIPQSRLNGSPKLRLPNNINISFDGVDGEMLLASLAQKNICISTGSACTATSTEPSYVLKAIGLSDALAKSSVRITLGSPTTKKEIDKFLKVLIATVKKLA